MANKNTKKKSILKNTNNVLKHKTEDLQKTIKELMQELDLKETIIQEYKKQLSLSNKLILKLTQQVDSDLQTLYRLYENLIPTQLPYIPDCEFSYKFLSSPTGRGKDFYQVIPFKRRNFGLIMSSCVSHIVSSLLFSSRLKLATRTDYKNLQPHDFLLALSKEMHEQQKNTEIDTKIDIFYGRIDQKKYTLSYCLAGSIYSFLYSFDTKKIHDLTPLSSSFNVEQLSSSSSQKVNLNPKDHLILCSPGVVECLNEQGEAFGVNRLKQVIHSAEEPDAHLMRNHILYSIKSFYKDQEISRDQSIFVMEIRDKILRLT